MTTKMTITITAALMYCFIPSIIHAAPFHKFDTDDCSNEQLGCQKPLFKGTPNTENIENIENLIYIPFPEITIRDFGIHKYVINRNIKTFMNYYYDPQLTSIIFSSINQSATEINRLVVENRAKFDSMSENEFVSNFLDFWCAYRMVQLFEFSLNNLDTFTNIIKNTTDTIRAKYEF